MSHNNCTCDGCAGAFFKLHIGDRIVFSGNIPGQQFHVARTTAQNAGLRVQGTVTKETMLVVTNETAEGSNTVRKAEASGIRVASPTQFKVLLAKMTHNGRNIHKAYVGNFNTIVVSGSKVYPIGLTPSELEKLGKVLAKKGGTIAQQIRPSLAAGIYNSESFDSGESKVISSEGIPIFDVNEL